VEKKEIPYGEMTIEECKELHRRGIDVPADGDKRVAVLEPEKKVLAIQWNSSDGQITFRERYTDGSVGPIESTSLETNNPSEFLLFKRKIEGERLGKIIN